MSSGIVICVVTVVLASALCLVTVSFLKALSRTASLLNVVHKRSIEQQNNLLDRLMAIDFAEFKTMQLTEEAPMGGQELPTRSTPAESRLRLTLAGNENARALLDEDFPEEQS